MSLGQQEVKAALRTLNVEYAIRDIVLVGNEVRKEGRDVLPLNIGDPTQFGFKTPPHIVEAIHRGMLANDTGYSPAEGIEEAISAIEREAAREGISNISHTCVTMGVSEGVDLALTALVNSGENVLLPTPGYPLYTAVLARLEAKANPYLLDEDTGWQPDVADIEAKVNDKTRAIVVINPNNPTGSLATREKLLEIVEIAKKYNLLIITDESYSKLLLNGEKHISLASLAGDCPCATFNGISKSYVGPGLRIGWVIISGDRDKTAQFTNAFMKMARARLCASTPMQWAIKPALEGPQTHFPDMIRRLKERSELVVSRINAIDGFTCVPPAGAFYVFPTIEDRASDKEFVIDLLRATGVMTVHGSGFGQPPGTKHIRIVTLPEKDVLERAMDLIEDFVKKRR